MTAFTRAIVVAMATALAPSIRMTPAAWVEAYRVLGSRGVAEPGPYRLSRTPYWRGVLEALGDPHVRTVVVVAPAQTGKSENGRNFLAYVVDQSPGPILIVFPTEEAAKEQLDNWIIPMFTDTPRLHSLVTRNKHDLKKGGGIKTATCTIYAAWSNSPNALASRPIQYVVLDEVDKYPAYRGKEADPISLATVRTKTFGHRSKVYIISTPTIPSGPIMRAYESCVDRRTYHVPCPSCGARAALEWEHVHWQGQEDETEEGLHARQAEFDSGLAEAWYECPSCDHKISDADRWEMIERGDWVSQHPGGRSRGFQVHGLSSPWTSFTEMALEYVTARTGGIEKLHHFFNNILGVPFWGSGLGKDGAQSIDPTLLWAKSAAGHEPGVAPAWTRTIIATADPGKDKIPWVIRAWGAGFRSRLLDYGVAESFEELSAKTLGRRWVLPNHQTIVCNSLGVDTGGGSGKTSASRTDEIYRFAKTDTHRITPLKGKGGQGLSGQAFASAPVKTGTHSYKPPGKKSTRYDVTLSVLDTLYFKDLTAARINAEDLELWELPTGMPADYIRQVSAEHRILAETRTKPSGEIQEVWRWVPRVVSEENHAWDLEVYQTTLAYMADLDRPAGVVMPTGGGYEAADEKDTTWTIGR